MEEDEKHNAAQNHATVTHGSLQEAQQLLYNVPTPDDATSTYPKLTVTALLDHCSAVLDQMSVGYLQPGQACLARDITRSVELLEKAGTQYNEVAQKLCEVVGELPEYGLSIDKYDLANQKYTGRLRGG